MAFGDGQFSGLDEWRARQAEEERKRAEEEARRKAYEEFRRQEQQSSWDVPSWTPPKTVVTPRVGMDDLALERISTATPSLDVTTVRPDTQTITIPRRESGLPPLSVAVRPLSEELRQSPRQSDIERSYSSWEPEPPSSDPVYVTPLSRLTSDVDTEPQYRDLRGNQMTQAPQLPQLVKPWQPPQWLQQGAQQVGNFLGLNREPGQADNNFYTPESINEGTVPLQVRAGLGIARGIQNDPTVQYWREQFDRDLTNAGRSDMTPTQGLERGFQVPGWAQAVGGSMGLTPQQTNLGWTALTGALPAVGGAVWGAVDQWAKPAGALGVAALNTVFDPIRIAATMPADQLAKTLLGNQQPGQGQMLPVASRLIAAGGAINQAVGDNWLSMMDPDAARRAEATLRAGGQAVATYANNMDEFWQAKKYTDTHPGTDLAWAMAISGPQAVMSGAQDLATWEKDTQDLEALAISIQDGTFFTFQTMEQYDQAVLAYLRAHPQAAQPSAGGGTMATMTSLGEVGSVDPETGMIVGGPLPALQPVTDPVLLRLLEEQNAFANRDKTLAEIGAEIERRRNQNPADIVEQYMNIGAELVFGILLDPTNLIAPQVTGKASATILGYQNEAAKIIGITAEQAQKNIDQATAAAKPIFEALTQGLQAKPDQLNLLDPRSWFRLTPESSANLDADWFKYTADFLLKDVTLKEDAKTLLTLFSQDPMALTRGVPVMSPELQKLGGVLQITPGIVGNEHIAKRYPILNLLPEGWVNQLATLQGEGAFNPKALMAELDSLFYRAASQYHGIGAIVGAPVGTVDLRLKRLPDGTGIIEYVGKDKKVIQSSAPMPFAQAERQVTAVREASKRGVNPFSLVGDMAQGIAGFQRAIMSDQYLALSPRNWIRNAGGAIANAFGVDSYSWLSTDNIFAELAKDFPTTPGARPFAAATGYQRGQQLGANQPSSGAIAKVAEWITRNPDNPVSKAMRGAYSMPYGTTQIPLGGGTSLGVGEEANSLKVFYEAFRKTKQSLLTDNGNGLLKVLSALPNPPSPEWRAGLANIYAEVGQKGSKQDLLNRVYQYINGDQLNMVTLKAMGIDPNLFTADGWKALNDVFARIDSLSDTDYVKAIDQIIKEESASLWRALNAYPPEPGVFDWKDVTNPVERDMLRKSLIRDAQSAGVDAAQAQTQADQIIEQIIQGEEAGWDAFRQDLAQLLPNATPEQQKQLWAAALDFAQDDFLARQQARRAADQSVGRALAEQTPEAWNYKWRATAEAWGNYGAGLTQMGEEYRTVLAGVMAGQPYSPKQSPWDVIANWMAYDPDELAKARSYSLGAPTLESAWQWEKVIAANRGYVDHSNAYLFESFRRYPTPASFDILVEALQKQGDIGAQAHYYTRGEFEKGLRGQRYYSLRDKTWNQAFDEMVISNQAYARAMVAVAVSETAGDAVKWTDDFAGGQFQLWYPNEDGTWMAKRLDNGQVQQFSTPGSGSALPEVPQEVLDSYMRTVRGEEAVDEVMAEVEQAVGPVEQYDVPAYPGGYDYADTSLEPGSLDIAERPLGPGGADYAEVPLRPGSLDIAERPLQPGGLDIADTPFGPEPGPVAPVTPAATTPTVLRATDLRRLGAEAGIGTITERGVPYDTHLVNAINKDLGLKVTSLEQLTPDQMEAAADALRVRAQANAPVSPAPVASAATPEPSVVSPVVEPQVVPPAAKEPWQMTAEEWLRGKEQTRLPGTGGGAPRGRVSDRAMQTRADRRLWFNYGVKAPYDETIGSVREVTHQDVIAKAVGEGKPVPAEVLADYPDLARTTPPAAKPVAVGPGTRTREEHAAVNPFRPTQQVSGEMRELTIVDGKIKTISGREIPAPPPIRLGEGSSDAKVRNDLRKLQRWLADQMYAETIARNDDFNLTSAKGLQERVGKFSQSDYDTANVYLFGFDDPKYTRAGSTSPAPAVDPAAMTKAAMLDEYGDTLRAQGLTDKQLARMSKRELAEKINSAPAAEATTVTPPAPRVEPAAATPTFKVKEINFGPLASSPLDYVGKENLYTYDGRPVRIAQRNSGFDLYIGDKLTHENLSNVEASYRLNQLGVGEQIVPPAAVPTEPTIAFGKGGQGDMFGSGEDLPLMTGGAYGKPDAGAFAPQEAAAKSPTLFDTRIQFGEGGTLNLQGMSKRELVEKYGDALRAEGLSDPQISRLSKDEIITRITNPQLDPATVVKEGLRGGGQMSTSDAREVVRQLDSEWDRVANAEYGLKSIKDYVFGYGRGQQGRINLNLNRGEVKTFEDLYGVTIAGRPINNINDVEALFNDYAEAQRALKGARVSDANASVFEKMTPAQMVDAVADELKAGGFSDADLADLKGRPRDVVTETLSDFFYGDEIDRLGWKTYDFTVPSFQGQATVDQAMEIVKLQDYGAPAEHIADYIRQNRIDYVTAYHVAPSAKVDSIRKTGLTSREAYGRKAAAYFFLDRDDAVKNAVNLVGDDVDYVILEINIPAKNAERLRWDGLYNVGFGTSYSAARLEQNIPPAWIVGSDLRPGMKTYEFTVPSFLDQDPNDARTLYQRLRDNLFRSRKTSGLKATEAGDITTGLIRDMEAAQRRLTEQLPYIRRGNIDNTLTPQQRLKVWDAARPYVTNKYDDILAQSSYVGTKAADWVMLNMRTGNRYVDQAIRLVAPFHYFVSRMPSRLAMMAVNNPAMVNLYWEAQQEIDRYHQQNQSPVRLTGTVPLGDTGYYMGNPLAYFIPFGAYTDPNPFLDPEKAAGPQEENINRVMQWNPAGLLPATQFALAAYLDWREPRADGTKRTDDFELGDFFPLYRITGYAAQGITGQPAWGAGGGLAAGDQYDEYRATRQAGAIGIERGLAWNDPVIAAANQIIKNRYAGQPEGTDVPPSLLAAATEIADQAIREAGGSRAVTTGGSWLTGVPIYDYPQGEQQGRQYNRDYAALGYNEGGNLYGSKAAQREYMEQSPGITGWWSKNDELPGVSAQVSVAYEERNRLKAEQEAAEKAAVDALDLSTATKSDIYNARTAAGAPYQAKIDALNAQIDDLKERQRGAEPNIPSKPTGRTIDMGGTPVAVPTTPQYGLPLAGMNPAEISDKFATDTLYMARRLPGKPEWPGDDASDAEKQAYYRANDAYKLAQEQAVVDRLTAPVTGDALAQRRGPTMYTEEQARQMWRDFQNQGKTEGEIARVAQIDEQNAVAAQWSPNWDEYQALGEDWAAKKQYMLDHPEFAAYYKDKYGNAWWEETSGGAGGKGKGAPGEWSKNWDEYQAFGEDWAGKKQYMLDHPEFAAYYKDRYGNAWWEEAARTGTGTGSYGSSRSYGGGGYSGGDIVYEGGVDTYVDPRYMDRGLWQAPQRQPYRPPTNNAWQWLQSARDIQPDPIRKWQPPRW